jgi:hypothetical protein
LYVEKAGFRLAGLPEAACHGHRGESRTEDAVRARVGAFMPGLLVAGSLSALAQPARPVSVFVTVAEVADQGKVTEADRERHSAAISAAQTARKDLDKALKAQFGNKRDKWPADAQQQYLEAEDAVLRANAEWMYRSGRSERLGDSAEDIKNSIQGKGTAGRKENLTVVPTLDQAELVVEVNGRRSDKTSDPDEFDNEYWVSVLLKAGPKMTAEQFAGVPRSYRLMRAGYPVTRLATPTDATPFWRFEGYGLMRWSAAANAISVLIEDFVNKNHATLTAAATR